ncbi:MAG: TerB N-terminal domain-containing protein [Oscillospiraceae bacterium]|nr:TerB N-terminal domain-containing protein [Oscillospiraceae bacterium]
MPDNTYAPPEILAMREIKSSGSAFARLYGAKDAEQFRQQALFLAAYADDYPYETLLTEDRPTYADCTVQQLRWYFCWRARVRRGDIAPTHRSYYLLYLYELLLGVGSDGPEQAAQNLAKAWLALRELDSAFFDNRVKVWFKDYYLCHFLLYEGFDCSFGALARRCGLARFYPDCRPETALEDETRLLLSHSGYNYRRSKFFIEEPGRLALLERCFHAALCNLEPLFSLHGIPLRETLLSRPERFSYYEPLRGTVVRLPQPPEPREVIVSHRERYRFQNGSWSVAVAAEEARGGSPAIGCVVRRVEAGLRELSGYRFALSPVSDNLMERWLRNENGAFDRRKLDRILGQGFEKIIDETTKAVYSGQPAEGTKIPFVEELERQWNEEPLYSIRRALNVPLRNGGDLALTRQFRKQGQLLAGLSDELPAFLPCEYRRPTYAMLEYGQLRSYISWRTALRRGEYIPCSSAYALLYCYELLHAIGTREPFRDLCALLCLAGPRDRAVARRLPGWLRDWTMANPQPEPFDALLRQYGAQRWFPELFLLDSDTDQLALAGHFANYKLQDGSFYRAVGHAPLRRCFDAVLETAARAFTAAGMDFHAALLTPRRPADRQPFEGIPVLIPAAGEGPHGPAEEVRLSPSAPALLGYLLRRMESRLRALARFPYPLGADPAACMLRFRDSQPALYRLVCGESFGASIDLAADRQFAARDSGFAMEFDWPRPRRHEKKAPQKPVFEEPPPEPVKVRVDFSQLDRIRGEARALTELLLVEDASAEESLPQKEEAQAIPANYSENPWQALRASMGDEQRRCVDFLSGAGAIPPPMDEILLESVNELALDYIGDTLIEDEKMHEEYRIPWKGTLERNVG